MKNHLSLWLLGVSIVVSTLTIPVAFWISNGYQRHLDALGGSYLIRENPNVPRGSFVPGENFPLLTLQEKDDYRRRRWLLWGLGYAGIVYSGAGSTLLVWKLVRRNSPSRPSPNRLPDA